MPQQPSYRIQKDQQIVKLLLAGDRQGVSMAYQQYGKVLYGYIYKVLQSDVLAEEALQDTFVKIWKNIGKYDKSKSQFFTWIVNIAKHTAIDRVRSASFQQEKKTTPLESLVSVKEEQGEESKVVDQGLQKVINSLDPKYRLLIDLTFFQGYSQREIAKEFDIPLGTVKTRYRTAINELRNKLSKEQMVQLILLSQLFNKI